MNDSLHQVISTLFDSISSHGITLTAGEILLNEGEASDRVYLLVEGELEISRSLNGLRPGRIVGKGFE